MNLRRAGRKWTAGLWLIATGIACAQFQEGQTLSGFRVPDYDEEGNIKSILLGEHAVALSDSLIHITELKLELFRKGERESLVTSPFCVFDRKVNAVSSTSSVRIVRSNLIITGEHYTWETKGQRFVIEKNARVVIQRGSKREQPFFGVKP